MSEHDLTKWKNKFRLYRTLHPEFMEAHGRLRFQDMCDKCLYSPPREGKSVKMLHCPANRLVTDDLSDVQRIWPLEKAPGCIIAWDAYCLEWIKNV